MSRRASRKSDKRAIQALIAKAGKRHKYGVSPAADRTLGGRVYPSKAQMRRAYELRIEERSGTIRDLREEVRFQLSHDGVDFGEYVADFVYERQSPDGWKMVVEDKKPDCRTEAERRAVRSRPSYRLFQLKAKLMLLCHGIEVVET